MCPGSSTEKAHTQGLISCVISYFSHHFFHLFLPEESVKKQLVHTAQSLSLVNIFGVESEFNQRLSSYITRFSFSLIITTQKLKKGDVKLN